MEGGNICKYCQECCRWLTFVLGEEVYKHFEEFYKARGCQVFYLEDSGDYAVMVHSTCQYLTSTGCAVYEQRPQECRKYDGRKDQFMKDKCKLPEEEWFPGQGELYYERPFRRVA